MRKFGFFSILFSFLTLFVFSICGLSQESSHPEIILMDYEGNEISVERNTPYSPKNTCGQCHDYDTITNAYHFQLGRTDADGNIVVSDDLDPKNPWLISMGMYGKW